MQILVVFVLSITCFTWSCRSQNKIQDDIITWWKQKF